MARFHYSLQSILSIKEKMETQAKQEFSSAKGALDREEEKLAELKERKRSYEKQAAELLSGKLDVREIEENQTAILRMDSFIAEQNVRVRRAKKALEEARERLTEVMKERKTHESLKEKAFESFLQEENRQESKEIDELTSYTYGQRQVSK